MFDSAGLRGARLALLGVWAGGLAVLGGVVVPAAFSLLPTQLAASVLGAAFNQTDLAGATLGMVCVGLGLLSLRGGARIQWLRVAMPLIGVTAHLLSYLWVSPQIHELRMGAGGTVGSLPESHPGFARFQELHELSRTLFVVGAATPVIAALWDLWAESKTNRYGRETP